MIKIGLIEDDLNYSTHLIKYFGFLENIELNFHAFSVAEGLKQLKKHKDTSILILDLGLPHVSGLQGIPQFRNQNQELEIIVLTVITNEDKIIKALTLGAASYLSKEVNLVEIYTAIETVNQGGSYLSSNIAREIIQHFVKGGQKSSIFKLTGKQRLITDMMVDGKTYKNIADHLNITVDTVKYHIRALYKNLEASNKAEAIAHYLKGSVKTM